MALSEAARTRVFWVATLALTAALGVGANDWEKTREELRKEQAANFSPRNLLGDMTKSMTEKEREIDRLSTLSCASPDGAPKDGSPQPERKAAVVR